MEGMKRINFLPGFSPGRKSMLWTASATSRLGGDILEVYLVTYRAGVGEPRIVGAFNCKRQAQKEIERTLQRTDLDWVPSFDHSESVIAENGQSTITYTIYRRRLDCTRLTKDDFFRLFVMPGS